jgi:hypothetical protein
MVQEEYDQDFDTLSDSDIEDETGDVDIHTNPATTATPGHASDTTSPSARRHSTSGDEPEQPDRQSSEPIDEEEQIMDGITSWSGGKHQLVHLAEVSQTAGQSDRRKPRFSFEMQLGLHGGLCYTGYDQSLFLVQF